MEDYNAIISTIKHVIKEGKYRDALSLCENLLDPSIPSNIRLKVLKFRAFIYIKQRKYFHSTSDYEDAANIASDLGLYNDQIECNLGIAESYFGEGEKEKALQYYIKANNLCKRNENVNKVLISKTAIALGNLYLVLEQQQKASTFFQTGLDSLLDVEKTTAIRKLLSYAFLGIGSSKRLSGDDEGSIRNFEEAFAFFKSINDVQGLITASSNIGNVYLGKKDFKKSINYFRETLRLSEENNNYLGMAVAKNNLAFALKEMKELVEAKKQAQEAIKIYKEIREGSGLAIAYSNLGEIHTIEEEYEEAIEAFSQAIELRKEMKDKKSIAHLKLKIEEIRKKNEDN